MNTETVSAPLSAVSRIARDLSDGLILIDNRGTVLYINPSARRLLENPALGEGTSYAEYMAGDGAGANDAFHQYVLDSIYEKNVSHTGTVTYTRADGSVRWFNMNASYTASDDGLERAGVILQFSDITELHRARIKYHDTIKILLAAITLMSLWNFLYEIWESAGEPVPSAVLTVIAELIGIAAAVLAVRTTSITVSDLGLGTERLKRALVFNSALTLAVLGVMIAVKFAMLRFAPGSFGLEGPFFRWNVLQAVDLLYIPTVILQEFLVRGVTQGSLERILPETFPPETSILITALIFGAIHIHKGLMYMLGAAFLVGAFGFVYRKEGTIWGMCIPHLVLSWSLRVIWGFQA